MKELIFKIEREDLEDDIKLSIYSKNEQNQTELKQIHINYTILVRKDKFEGLNINSDKVILATDVFLNKNNEKISKYIIKSKELYDYLLKQLKEAKIETYETDLLPEHRYLIDEQIMLSDDSKPTNTPELKHLSIDIETIGPDINNQEIVMISSYSPQDKKQNKVYVNLERIDKSKINSETNRDYEVVLEKNEKELLKSFKKNAIDFQPQIIIGWNVIDFDFKIVKERMKLHNIEFNFSKFSGRTQLRINTDFFKDSTLQIPGILVFDAIHLLKTNFISFDDYKLNTVAKEVLGDNKIDIESENDDNIEDKAKAIKDMLTRNPSKLIEYNFKDSYLTSKIVDKLNLLKLMIQRSIITNTLLTKVKSPIASLDIMYLTALHKKGYIAPSNFNYTDQSRVEGAYVIEPKSGFYKDIFVFDFKSLYPSIIMTFNIDPFTYNENGEIEAPNGVRFDKTLGILPQLISKLYKERDVSKKKNNKIKSNALKLTMNSFWGAIASPKSRFYNSEIGDAITGFARYITKRAQKYIEQQGHKVIYGDTDSIFIKFNKEFKNFEEKKEFGIKTEHEINSYFDKWVKEKYKQDSMLKIEFEKLYSNFFIASKKRYVGYDEFTQKTQFVGMEAIRGDWTELAKSFQVNIVNQIFSNKTKEKIKDYIKNYIKKLEDGKFDNLLIYQKKITKPLSEYTRTTPPHVKAAREVENFKGRIVKYVIGKDGPKHISLIDENFKFDYDHYIEKQLAGVSDDLLDAFGIDIKKLIKMRGQKSLNKFF